MLTPSGAESHGALQGASSRHMFSPMRLGAVPAFLLAGPLLVGCSDNGTGPSGASLQLLYGNDASDTVQATLTQALVVEVRGENGGLISGTVVRFQSLPIDSAHPYQPGVWLASLTSNFFSSFVADSTDSRGRASAVILLGTVTGAAKVVVTAPEFGLEDTARFTVLPGNAARVVVQPKDTALYATKSFQSRATVTDRFGNARSDPVSYSAAGAGLTVTSTGSVTAGASLRRTFYLATAVARTDTGWVSIVPGGTLAALQVYSYAGHGVGIAVFNLDGSGYDWLGPGGADYGADPAWVPGGTLVAFGRNISGNWIYTADLMGNEQLLVTPVTGLVGAAWPHYSRDGAYLYFSGLATSVGNFALWRANADGTNPQQLYADPSGIAWRSSPSPDGTRLAFVNASQSPSGIQVYTIASQTVSPWAVVGQTPRWSPAGETIAFVAPYGGPIFVVNADGTGARQVSPTGRSYDELSLGWSPDGAWLVARGPDGLELINVATGAALPLAYSTPFVQPAWKP